MKKFKERIKYIIKNIEELESWCSQYNCTGLCVFKNNKDCRIAAISLIKLAKAGE